MNAKEAFAKLSALVFKSEHKFENAKLSDGTILQWEGELKDGVAIMVVDEQGNMTPAPDGTHVLDGGVKVTTVGGLVSAIETEQNEDEDMKKASQMMEDFRSEFESKLSEYASQVSALDEKLKGYEAKFAAIEKTVSDTGATIETNFEEIKKIVSEIESQPAVPAPKPKEAKFSKKPQPGASAAERIAAVVKSKQTN